MSAEILSHDFPSIDPRIQEIADPIRSRQEALQAEVPKARDVRLGNRRNLTRVSPAPSDLVVHLNGESVSVVDFSMRGLQLRFTPRFAPGTTVMVRIRWRDEQQATMALARVLWITFERSHRFAVPQHRVGAIFDTVDLRMIRAILSRCGLGTGPPGVEIDHFRG
jgi:PilZ domain